MQDFEPVDEYRQDELDYLRQELEEMEIKVDKWKELADTADSLIRVAKDDANRAKIEYQKKSIDVNAQITAKCNHYLQVIEEYQRIISEYIGITGTNMVTNKLIQLRKEGELDV